MNHLNQLFMTFLLISMVFFPSYASTTFSIHCPQNIKVTQQLLEEPSGWHSLKMPPYHFLNGINLYSGKPENSVSLKPQFSSRNHSTWKFASHEEIYITCEYNQTSIQLTQHLPKHTTQCSVWYDLSTQSTQGFIPQRIQCKSLQ